MFKTIRYEIGSILLARAHKLIKKGDFKSIMKGLDYTKTALMIVPPSEELTEFMSAWRKEAENRKQKLNEERP